MDPDAWAALWNARYNRPPRQAIDAMPIELQAQWRARYCLTDEVDLRARSLVDRTADEMRAAAGLALVPEYQ